MGNTSTKSRSVCTLTASILAALVLACSGIIAIQHRVYAAQSPKAEPAISVRYTDVRERAKITFRQDSTQTEDRNYLETTGTGVAWIDYDQDGLMDLYFVQPAATDFYKPPHPLRSALYHNKGDGTFRDATQTTG